MTVSAADEKIREREWWLRLLLVLQSPRTTFAALRDDSDEAAAARAEPVLAVVVLAGVASVLSTNLVGQLLDDGQNDALVVVSAAVIGGVIQGALLYFLLGLLLSIGLELAGSGGSYRRDRHVLAFACAPLALSLLAWPVRVAIFGEDVFRSGGSDSGTGGTVFEGIEVAALGWSALLVIAGVKTLESWSWVRATLASTIVLALPALALCRAYGVL